MEPIALTAESTSILDMILSSGLLGVASLSLSILMLFFGIIGLLVNKTRISFYIWILETLIKFALLSCALIFAVGLTKFGQTIGSPVPANYEAFFIFTMMDMMCGVALILLIALIAFIAKTIAEIKPKYKCQPES